MVPLHGDSEPMSPTCLVYGATMEDNPMEDALAAGDRIYEQEAVAFAESGEEVGKAMSIAGTSINLVAAMLTENRVEWAASFPNDASAAAGLAKALRSLRASMHLVWSGYPDEAMALVRLAYEAAGLARVLGKDPTGATEWMMKGYNWPDSRVRKWIREQRDPGAAADFAVVYKMLSAYAHPSAESCIRLLEVDGEDGPTVRLESRFEATTFIHVLWMIAQTAVFVMFCARNAAAGEQGAALPSWWHSAAAGIVEAFEEWTGSDEQDSVRLRDFAAEHQRRYGQLQENLADIATLDDVLDEDPRSWRNLSKHADEDVNP